MNKMLISEFMENFKCIGSLCESTCCSSWDILIDKNTYFQYRKVKDKKLKKLIDGSIELNNTEIDSHYAKIKLNQDNLCPLLDESKLCTIHKQLGENALCYTCKVYPKNYNKIGNLVEKSVMISCPEVARLALLNPNKMTFKEIEIEKDVIYYPRKKINDDENLFWLSRIFTIDLLQNREFRIWERLIILGLFLEEASEVIKNKEEEKLKSIIDSFNYLLKTNEIKFILESYDTNTNFQLNIVSILNDARLKFRMNDNVFLDCVDEFNKGLDIGNDFEEKRYELYNNNYFDYYAPFMERHEYIMENYLVHYVFIETFPFTNDKSIFDEYCMLILNYALVKAYLIGMSGFYKKMNESIIVRLIHSFHRTYHHGNQIMEYVFLKLKDSSKMTLKNMTFLIKN